jgi:rhamnosyltransferase
MSPAPVTVVMRTKNCAWVVDQALAALHAQDFTDFELLVVDSGSTDATLDMVARTSARIVRIPPENYVPGAVLNDAMESVASPVVVFQNADTVPLHASALRRLLAPLRDPDVVAAFARQVPRPEALAWVRRDYENAFPASGPAPDWMPLSLPFAAMRRSAWEQHRFYTAAWGSEDTEWGHWARGEGHRVAYVPDCRVMHSHNYTLRQIFGRRFIEGEADAFIAPGRTHGPLRALLRSARATAADVLAAVRERAWSEIAGATARRTVYHWAYLRGQRHGTRRRRTGDADLGTGQRVVLSRHESVR